MAALSLLLYGFFSSCSERELSSGCSASAVQGFSLQWLLCCEAPALGHMDFSSCGSQALEHKLSSCSAWA